MDIHEATKAKQTLESALRALIQTNVNEFTALTGLCPDSISVDTARFEIIGKVGYECRISGVRVEVRL